MNFKEKLNEVRTMLESAEENTKERNDLDSKLEALQDRLTQIKKQETQGFISKDEAEEAIKDLNERIDKLKI